jgi:hypothetical protein
LSPSSSFTSDTRTYSSNEYSFTLQYPPTIQLRTFVEGYFDLLKDNQIIFQASVEDDAFKIFMYESKAAGDVFRSFARHRCKIICDADGPDGSVYCDKIASEKGWRTRNGLRVLEFYLIMTREDYNENTKEESRMGPVYVVDMSRKGRPVALMIHPGHGILAADLTKRLMQEIINSVIVLP